MSLDVFDPAADALYLRVAAGEVARTIEVDSGTLIDVDAEGQPLGIEVIHPSRPFPLQAIIDLFSSADARP